MTVCKACGVIGGYHKPWCAQDDVHADVRYTFLGLPVRPDLLPKIPDHMTLFDLRHGTHVVRRRTAEYVGVPRKARAA